MGTILNFGRLDWPGEGANARAVIQLRLESSGIARTSIQAAAGVHLPSFSQWRSEQSLEVVSGVPNYFTFRGPPTPSSPGSGSTVYIARLVVTGSPTK